MLAPIHHQVVVYAADPQRLARFWAAAMGYELENNEVMIGPLLAAGVAQESDTVVVDGQRFWDGVLAIRHPDDPVDEKTGIVQGRRILFELQQTEKTDENRLHLDLNVGKDRIDEETAADRRAGRDAAVRARGTRRGPTSTGWPIPRATSSASSEIGSSAALGDAA